MLSGIGGTLSLLQHYGITVSEQVPLKYHNVSSSKKLFGLNLVTEVALNSYYLSLHTCKLYFPENILTCENFVLLIYTLLRGLWEGYKSRIAMVVYLFP